MRRVLTYIVGALFIFSLSGCSNPGSEAAQNHIAYKAQISAVQEAVNAFKKDTGVLPIKNSTEKTPIYKKYPVDFDRLATYTAKPPFNAYEEGGIFQYVLVDAETHPLVKVIDLTLVSKVQEIERKIKVFRYNHDFSPLGGIITKGRYKIDFKKLSYDKPPHVISPYSGRELGFVMDQDSKVYINYLPDIYDAVKKSGKTFKEGKDLRFLLVQNTPYVPVDSLPYTMKNGQVVFKVQGK